MSLIPSISNPYLAAFIGGLSYGMVVCTASCLPYLASYIAGIGAGFRKSFEVTAVFSVGRIAGYAALGAVVGVFSGLFKLFVSSTAVSPFQTYSAFAFAAVTIAIGAFILLKTRSPTCDCQPAGTVNLATAQKGRFGFDFGAFTLGLSRGLIICPPLVALLLYSVPFASPLGSVGLAVLFGLGTTVSPALLLGGVTGWLLSKAPLFRRWVSIAGGAFLILLGIVTLIQALTRL
jgi:cytochrome c-type biogenesis protein